MKSLPILLVEDDIDMQFLIKQILSMDSRLGPITSIDNAPMAYADAQKTAPILIILDHVLEGEITGLQAAPLLKAIAPKAKILLFTTQDLSFEASQEPTVHQYLSKSQITKLLPTVQRLIGLEPLG